MFILVIVPNKIRAAQCNVENVMIGTHSPVSVRCVPSDINSAVNCWWGLMKVGGQRGIQVVLFFF
jgi:hypothetical protein